MMNGHAEKKDLLLHCCCGPCSTSVVERLAAAYRITLFYYNPNITDPEEFQRRRDGVIQFLSQYNARVSDENQVQLRIGDHEAYRYDTVIAGLEGEPEGGMRCQVCYRLRLEETAKVAENEGYSVFGTTLSVSPHKSHAMICTVGEAIAAEKNLVFLTDDFKKKAGFSRSVQLSKEFDLYRQTYCGCPYSK